VKSKSILLCINNSRFWKNIKPQTIISDKTMECTKQKREKPTKTKTKLFMWENLSLKEKLMGPNPVKTSTNNN